MPSIPVYFRNKLCRNTRESNSDLTISRAKPPDRLIHESRWYHIFHEIYTEISEGLGIQAHFASLFPFFFFTFSNHRR